MHRRRRGFDVDRDHPGRHRRPAGGPRRPGRAAARLRDRVVEHDYEPEAGRVSGRVPGRRSAVRLRAPVNVRSRADESQRQIISRRRTAMDDQTNTPNPEFDPTAPVPVAGRAARDTADGCRPGRAAPSGNRHGRRGSRSARARPSSVRPPSSGSVPRPRPAPPMPRSRPRRRPRARPGGSGTAQTPGGQPGLPGAARRLRHHRQHRRSEPDARRPERIHHEGGHHRSTTVTKSVSGTVDDIKVGDTVTVVGSGSDTIAATRVTDDGKVSADANRPGPAGRAGQRRPAPGRDPDAGWRPERPGPVRSGTHWSGSRRPGLPRRSRRPGWRIHPRRRRVSR